MNENRELIEAKEVIALRLAALERSIAKAEESIGSLEQSMDVEVGEMKAGLGPIFDELKAGAQGDDERPPVDKTFIDAMLEHEEGISPHDVQFSMTNMGDRVGMINEKIEEIFTLNVDKLRFLSANPTLMPVEGWVTSDFGMRHSPWSGSLKMHYGLDIASPVGTSIRAPSDGRVVFADTKGGYGRLVMLDHGYGLTTLYGHTSKIFVQKGQLVKRGDVIAAVGSTGSSTGPHLHYEVHVDGLPTDPLAYVVQ